MRMFEIWMVNLPSEENSHVQQGYRPVVVVSNDAANRFSSLVTVVPITSKNKKPLPTHVSLNWQGKYPTSTALCEQILTIDQKHCRRCVGFVSDASDRMAIRRALNIQLGMAS